MANVNVKVGYTIDKSGLNEIKKQLADIRVEAKTADVLGNLTPQLKEAGQAAAKLEDILNSAWNSKIGQLDMGKVNNEIIKTWKSADNLGKALINGGKNGAIAFSSFASTILNSNIQLKQSSQLLDKMAITLKNTVRYGISSSIFNNLTNSVRKAYDYTVKLDTSLNDIRIVTGKSADEMDRFAVRANQVAKDLGRSTKDFTEAALIYYQQGLGNEEAQARAEVTMKAANVTGQSGREVSEQLTAVWNGYKVSADEAEAYVDKLSAVAATTAADLEELSTGMSKVAAAANLMGVDVDQLNAQLATIVSVTKQAPESVGVALKTIFARMSDIKSGLDDETTLGNYTSKMAQYGVNVLDANNNLRDMGDVIEEIGTKWTSMSREQQVALAQTMAGTRQYNNLLSLFDNWDMYMDALDTSKNSLGELQKQQDIYMQSTKAHLEQLATEAEKTYSILFDQDSIRGFIDMMNDALSLLNTYLRGLGGGMQTITTLGLQVANVFSNQISGSISRQVENRRIQKNNENVDLLRSNFIESYGMSDTYDQLDNPQKARIDTEVEYAQKIGQVKDVLTEKEAQQLTEQQKQTGELTEQLEIYKQIRQEIQETLNLTENDDFAEALTNELEESADKIDRINQKLADTEKATAKIEQKQKKLNDKKEKTGSLTADEEKQLQDLNDELEDQVTIENNFKDELKEEKQHYNELNNLNQKRGNITDEVIENTEKERDSINNSINDTIRLKEEQQSINNVLKGTTTILSTITTSIGVIKTLNDDNLSGWEKFGSVVTALGAQAAMIAMNYSSLKTMMSDVVKLLGVETVVTEALAKAREEAVAAGMAENLTRAQTLKITLGVILAKLKEIAVDTLHNVIKGIQIVLQTILNALTGNFGPIVAAAAIAVTAMVAALGAWAISMITATAEENRLKKSVEEAKEEVQKATEAYNELKDTISKYNDARKAIDDLTEGTVEFYEAVMKSNEAAQELIDSLNLLVGKDYTIDSNGLITIDPDVLSERQFRSQQEIYRRSANANSAQAALEQYNQDKIVKQFAAEVNRQSMHVRISDDQAKAILSNSENSNTELGLLNTSFNTYGPGWIAATEKSSVDITNAIAKYMPQYTAAQAKIDSLAKQQSANLIRGYGDQAFVDQYNKMTAAQQDNINKYVADQIKVNQKDLKAKDKNFWDYLGDFASATFLNTFTLGMGGTISAISRNVENESNKRLAKEEYAKNAQGYKQDEKTGTWYDRYGNSVDIEEVLKTIDTKTAVNAYNSGEYSTLKAAEEMTKVIKDAKNKAYLKGADEVSQNYVAEAYSALKSGNKYDYNLLTNEEKDIVKGMLGGRTTFKEIKEEPKYSTYYNPYNLQKPGTIDYTQFGQGPQFNPPYYQQTQPQQGGQTRYEVKREYTEVSSEFSTEQVDKWLEHTDNADRSVKRIKADLEEYNAELKTQAEELDTSVEALKLYGFALEKATGEENKHDRLAAKNIARTAKFNKVYNEGIEVFEDAKDGYEQYVKALKKGEVPSLEAAEAAAEIQKNLEELSGLELSEHFLGDPDNLKDIQKLYTGTEKEAEEAYNRLLVKMQKDNVATILQEMGQNAGTAYEDLYNTASSWVDQIANLEPGATLSDEFTKNLINMVNNAQMSTEELEQLFNALDLEVPPIDTNNLVEPTVEYVDVPGSSVTHHYSGEYPVPQKDGTLKKEKIDYYWTESQAEHKQPYVKFDDNQKFTKNTVGNSSLGRGSTKTGGFTKSPGNSKSDGGGGSSKEPDKMDPVEKEIDRYHDVDIQLKQIKTDMDKLDKQKKKLFGADLIANLNKQLKLLDKQIDTTNDKIKIAQGESQELRDKLSGKGVTFNADGTIANYAQAYAAQLNYVNSLIADYNNMSASAQESYKETVEKAKEDFDKFTEQLSRYDQIVTDLIPGLEADIQAAVDEKIDLQIEKFDMEIELRLDLAEAERDWNEFKKKIIDGIEDDDILGNAMAKLVDFSSYYKEDNTGIVQALRKQVDNTLAELNAMDTNGWSQVYGDNRTAALEDLQKYYKELMTNLEDVLELQKEIHESYIDMMDEAQEKFDEQIEAYEMISDLIEHDMEVISLVYGEESYGQLAKYYDKQQQNFNSQLDFQRQQVNFWRQQLDALEEGSDEWENAKEKWEDAVKEMNSLIEESIQNLQDKYLNAINLIFQNLNNKVTDNLGLDYIDEEWNLINQNADQYLDTINSLYEVQKLESKYLDALDQTDNISAQRQLKKIMDEELADLRERDKLTQYDIERANKKYEIALKQIALQEAQQNKSKMRLRRDSQGNYRYEYTSDADQVGQLQDELNDMYNSLYNFDKSRYQENLNQMYSVWVEFQEKMAEAAQINDPVARSERELLLQTQYEQLINGLTEQNATVRNNLHESAFDDLAKLYDIDVSNFQNMSDEEKNTLMGDLIPYWESGVQHMTDVFAGDGGFIGVCKDAFEQLHEATRDYEDGLDELEVAGRIDFESLGEGIDEDIERTQELLEKNNELIEKYGQELEAIGKVITELDDLVTKYKEAKQAAIEATEAAYKYWSEQQRQAAVAAGGQGNGSGSGNGNSGSDAGSGSGNGSGGGTGGSGGDGNLLVGETATYSGRYYYDSYGSSPTGSKYSGVANGIVVDKITNNPYGIHIHSADGRYRDLGWVKKSQLSGYDTGGYTGEWGSDGRLALLHQKELVLNKEDTANMLNAISIMRNITNMLGSSVLGKLAAATAGGIGTDVGGDVLEQNVHIDAQFPNVKDSREIEEALNNLVNMASMRANRR